MTDSVGQVGFRIAEDRCIGRLMTGGRLLDGAAAEWVAGPGVNAVLCNLPVGELQPCGLIVGERIPRHGIIGIQQPGNLLDKRRSKWAP